MNLIKHLVDQKIAAAAADEGATPRAAMSLQSRPAPIPAPPGQEVPARLRALEAERENRVVHSETAERSSRRVWELLPDSDDQSADTKPESNPKPTPRPDVPVQDVIEVPNPLKPKQPRHAGRVKTRLLGFGATDQIGDDLFHRKDATGENADKKFPVGWLVVTKGPGRGAQFALHSGISAIGRGDDQAIALNFGDDTISRNNHAAIAYDDRHKACFLGYGGKANLVRLNDRPVLATEQLSNADTISVGQTTLRFVALCGADFDWNTMDDDEDRNGAQI